MVRICMRCGLRMGWKPPVDNHEETHGLCDDCGPAWLAEARAARAQRRVDEQMKKVCRVVLEPFGGPGHAMRLDTPGGGGSQDE